MTSPTPAELAEWKRQCHDAHDGPWENTQTTVYIAGTEKIVAIMARRDLPEHRVWATAAFIAVSRDALPRLIAEVERLTKMVEGRK